MQFPSTPLERNCSTNGSARPRTFTGFLYQLWDAQKIQGCKCDLGYSGPDCASRVAPKGDDPLTTVKSTMGVQSIQIDAQAGAFSLIYHDPYGGVWRTDGIAASTDDAVVAVCLGRDACGVRFFSVLA